MLRPFTRCEIYRTSNKSEIISVLEKYPFTSRSSEAILIGSRAARYSLPNFRGIAEYRNADWDIICSSNFLLRWLCKRKQVVTTINMIIPTSPEDNELDVYVYCTLPGGFKYDFDIPRSSTSYTAYLLNNSEMWIIDKFELSWWRSDAGFTSIASAKLLLILKKYMLYYSHQWEKTAKDYRELLTVTEPLNNDDMVLRDLFVRYNEKVFGERPYDIDEFVIEPTNTRTGIIITQDEFFRT